MWFKGNSQILIYGGKAFTGKKCGARVLDSDLEYHKKNCKLKV